MYKADTRGCGVSLIVAAEAAQSCTEGKFKASILYSKGKHLTHRKMVEFQRVEDLTTGNIIGHVRESEEVFELSIESRVGEESWIEPLEQRTHPRGHVSGWRHYFG